MHKKKKKILDTKLEGGMGLFDDVKGGSDWHSYRRDDEEFAAHEVEQAHGAGAVGVAQQGAVMAPRHPSPLGVWILWHCGKADEKLESSYKKQRKSEIQRARGFLIKPDEKTLREIIPGVLCVCR